MAAPSYASAGDGTFASTGGNQVGIGGGVGGSVSAGQVVIVQILQDGTGTDTIIQAVVDQANPTTFESLDGVEGTLTAFPGNPYTVGGAKQFLWIGRSKSTTCLPEFTSAGDDIYCRTYAFNDVNTGTTLASVIEQNGTTTPATSSGTSITIADADVITTGVDRLALNFVACNDDNALDAFTGMTGGTWVEAVAEYANATGTDGAIGLQTATMATAGTIGGGTDTMAASDGWGVVGFALIGTTAATAYAPVPPNRSQSVLLRL